MIEPDLAFCSLNSIFTVPATNVKATHVPLPSAPGHPVPRGHGSLEPYPFSSPKILQQWRDPELDLCGTDCPVLQGGIGRRMREGHRFSQDTTLGEEVSGAVIAQPETQLRAGSAGAHEFILQGDSLRPPGRSSKWKLGSFILLISASYLGTEMDSSLNRKHYTQHNLM